MQMVVDAFMQEPDLNLATSYTLVLSQLVDGWKKN